MADLLTKTLLIYGLAIVVSLGIAAVIKVIVVGLNSLARRPATTAVSPDPVAAGDKVDANHVAAIAAAVYATLGSTQIVHIEPARQGAEWVAGGRLAHHGSHARNKPVR
jgi:hypothetical protein